VCINAYILQIPLYICNIPAPTGLHVKKEVSNSEEKLGLLCRERDSKRM
jgi:hypothetical protein